MNIEIMFAFDQLSITQSDIKMISTKVSSSYHLCVKCFSQLSFDSEMYTKSTAVTFIGNKKLFGMLDRD